MPKPIFVDPHGDFQWIDYLNPSYEELLKVADQYHLHPTSVKDCLDPQHLPKFERIGDGFFVIIRAFDETGRPESKTIRELTRKVAFFVGKTFLITVHRKEVKIPEQIPMEGQSPQGRIVTAFIRSTLDGYEAPLQELQKRLELFEEGVFGLVKAKASLKEGFLIKRKASAFRRLLRLTLEVIGKIEALPGTTPPTTQDLKESAERLLFQTDDLIDDITGLVSLHLSLSTNKMEEASFRTNEVMRVLTLFSVFFMPLNFIAGLYGMNFRNIPELETKYGYFVVLGVMFALSLSIYLWFLRKGWMNSRPLYKKSDR